MKSLPALAALMLVAVACASFYTGIVTITSTVDLAMKYWAQASAQGHTTAQTDAAITAAHDKYRVSCGIAQTALTAYKVSGDPATYNQAVAGAKAAANQLLDLIVPLIDKANGTALRTQLSNAKTL